MRWMESIRLRVSHNACSEALRIIRSFEMEMKNSAKLQAWQVYRHAVINGDFSISLHWNTETPDRNGSILAYNLVKMLSALGVVNHSLWIAQTDFKFLGSLSNLDF